MQTYRDNQSHQMDKTHLKVGWSVVSPAKSTKQENQDLKKEQTELMRLRTQLILEISEMAKQMGYDDFRDVMNKQYGYPFVRVIKNKNLAEPIRMKPNRSVLKIALSMSVVSIGRWACISYQLMQI